MELKQEHHPGQGDAETILDVLTNEFLILSDDNFSNIINKLIELNVHK